MLTKEEIIRNVEEKRKMLKALGVKKLVLFGSYAKDEQKKDSDIDFLVEFEKGRGLFDDVVNTLKVLKDLFGKDIDLVKKHLIRKEFKEYVLEGKQIEAKI